MKTIGAFDAKTHLSALLNEVASGSTIQITRRGVPIARLVPEKATSRPDLQKVADELRIARKGKTLKRGDTNWRELIHEGHRY
jgi:prevent-host-death family protein